MPVHTAMGSADKEVRTIFEPKKMLGGKNEQVQHRRKTTGNRLVFQKWLQYEENCEKIGLG